MARSYANVFTAIWRLDGDFIQRSAAAQRLYLLLFTQAEISACGALPLRLPRWAAMSPDSTESDVRQAMKELQEYRYIIFDEFTGELLVRSFTRHDGGYGNPRRRPSIRDAANAIESRDLLRVLAVEFERLGLPEQWRGRASMECLSEGNDGLEDDPPDNIPPGGRFGTNRTDGEDMLWAGQDAHQDDPKPQVNSHSDSQSIGNQTSMECLTDSRRVVVTKGPYIEPQPTTHNPQPFPATPGANAPPADPDPLTINQRAKRITDAYHAVEPMSKWPAVNAVVIKAIKTDRWADDAIRDALLRLAADNRAVTVDTLRIELGGRTQSNVVAIRAPTNGGRKPSTADQRMADAIALANHFAELDGEAQPP